MNDRKSLASSSARLIEEVRRGWYWVVFVISVLGRVGGIKEWIQTLKRLVNLLSSRLEQIPNLTTAGFSALAPGTCIAPHTGYPDGVLRCHLGLVIPPDCALRVGDDVQAWENGKCLIFDDTAEHEAWNRSDRTRVVLLLDFAP